MQTWFAPVVAFLAVAALASCQTTSTTSATSELAGTWRARVQFADGPYSSIKDLEFMYSFHSDGTMLESSNYDAAPPVPPAYGIWREIGPHKFEAKYEFYVTRYPDSAEHMPEGTGWLPGGRGVLLDTILIGSDGLTFSARTSLTLHSLEDSVTGVSAAEGRATKMSF